MRPPASSHAAPLPALRGRLAQLCAAGLLALGASVCAQTPVQAWQARHDQAQQAYAAGDLATAGQVARDALAQARAGQGSNQPYVASSLNLLALIRLAQGQPEEAAGLLGEALTLSEQALGAHPNTASLAFNLAQALEALQRPREAVPHYEHSLAIADGLGSQPGAAGLRQNALAALSRLHAELGQVAQAEAHTRRLLASETAAAAPLRAEALARQALTLQVQGRHDEAEPLHREAMALREALNPDDPAIAVHLNELALWHLQRQQPAQAQVLFERALALVERHQGASSLEAARLVASLALLHGERGEDAQAQALHQRALAIYQRFGETPEALLGQAHAMNHLAGAIYRKRRLKEAEPMFQQALAWLEQALGPQDARLLPLLDNLQALYRSQGRLDLAQRYARRAESVRLAGTAAAGQGAAAPPTP